MLRDTRPDLGESQDLWRVWLAGGERTMSLEMLDALFEDGVITADTQVCPPDGTAFARLGEIAGLDEVASEQGQTSASVEVDLAPSVRAPQPYAPAAPVYAAQPARYPAAPTPADSMRPMAMSFDLGSDMAAMKPGFSFKKKMLAIPAVLGVLGIIAIAASAGASTEAAKSVSAASMRTEIAAPAIAVAPAPEPVVAPTTPAAPAPAAPVLTDAQKKALALKDKKAEAAAAAKAKRAAASAPRKSSGKSSSPFSKGGNAHDPLNGSL